jgi:hypothetical protein
MFLFIKVVTHEIVRELLHRCGITGVIGFMFIEVTTGNAEDQKNYMRKLLRTFIETKMKTYSDLEAQSADPVQDAAKTKYLASLWMIFSAIGIMQREEIAQQSGIACCLLQGWESDKEFNALVACNYKEFLICIVDLFA